VERLAGMFTYIDAIIVDTPVFDVSFRRRILDARLIQDRIKRGRVFIEYLDLHWKAFDGYEIAFPWPDLSQSLKQQMDVIQRRIASSGKF
jgi:hypothetical protein